MAEGWMGQPCPLRRLFPIVCLRPFSNLGCEKDEHYSSVAFADGHLAQINTLGWPQARWWPDPQGSTSLAVVHPVPKFQGQGIDWQNYTDVGRDMVGNGSASRHFADGLITSMTMLGFRTFEEQMEAFPVGWRSFTETNDVMAVLNTRRRPDGGRGLALQNRVVYEVFSYLQEHNYDHAQYSIGWTGSLQLEVPSVAVQCGRYQEPSGQGSVVVLPVLDNDPRTWFEMSIKPLAANQTQIGRDFSTLR